VVARDRNEKHCPPLPRAERSRWNVRNCRAAGGSAGDLAPLGVATSGGHRQRIPPRVPGPTAPRCWPVGSVTAAEMGPDFGRASIDRGMTSGHPASAPSRSVVRRGP
jgi:hypothetical protein